MEILRKIPILILLPINEITPVTLERFWKDIGAEDNIDSYRLLDKIFDQQRDSFFNQEDQPPLLAKFSFDKIRAGIGRLNPITQIRELELTFHDTKIYIFPSGLGIFASRVKVNYAGELHNIKINVEPRVKEIIEKYFEDKAVQDSLKRYVKEIKSNRYFKVIEEFQVGTNKYAKLAWIHSIYWFYQDGFLKHDIKGKPVIKEEFLQSFTDLFEEIPNTISFLQNRFVSYGWGRSLIITEAKNDKSKQWAESKVRLAEVGQYSCFGHVLLDVLLKGSISRLTMHGSIVDQPSASLRSRIEKLDEVIAATVTYLEEFRSGIDAILHSGQPSLVRTLEDYWRIGKLEEDIRSKLYTLHKEREALEHSLVTNKQDRLTRISSAFTIMNIASVTAAVVALSPLGEKLRGEQNLMSISNQVFIFIFATLAVISITVVMTHRWNEICQKIQIRNTIGSFLLTNKYKNQIKNPPEEARPLTRNKEERRLETIKREIQNSFSERKIDRSQFRSLKGQIERYKRGIPIQ